MKYFLIISIFSFFISSMSHAFETSVVLRKDNGKVKISKVTLTDLISDNSFDGKYFKIVHGKSNAAITFDADKELLLKAATVYYHLTRARAYFVNYLNSEYVRNLPRTVIRIDLQNMFNELGHFANDNKKPQFNNALTVPEGAGFPSRGIEPWGKEIWFRPGKVIKRSEVNFKGGANVMKPVLENFRMQTHMSTLSRFLAGLINPNINYTWDLANIFRTFGSSVIIELGYQTMDELTELFGRKRFWLESALVPEIIYHEYSHLALSDHLELSHSTPVIEGMADIFASLIGETSKLALKIKKYNTFNGKNAKNKNKYMTQFESTDYANSDFVFGLLWGVKNIVGDESPFFLYSMRKSLLTSGSIKNDLLESILKTCTLECSDTFQTRLKLLKLFNVKGI